MIEKSNIRFSYEQKNRFLRKQNHLANEKHKIGKLLSREDRSQHLDDQQEEFLMKKSTVLPGDSSKNSQVFSDAYLKKTDKLMPKRQVSPPKYSFEQEFPAHQNKYNADIKKMAPVLHAPKSLPQVIYKQRQVSDSQSNRQRLNSSLTGGQSQANDERSFTKGKSFSINHYDIYKPGFLVNRKELDESAKREISGIEQVSEKNSSFVESAVHQELQEEKPHQPLHINFQNSTDRDLMEIKEDQVEMSERISKNFNIKQQSQREKREQIEVKDLVRENIVIEKRQRNEIAIPPRPKHDRNQKLQGVSRHHRVVSEFRKRKQSGQSSFLKELSKREDKPSSKHTSRSSKKSQADFKHPARGKIKEENFMNQMEDEDEQFSGRKDHEEVGPKGISRRQEKIERKENGIQQSGMEQLKLKHEVNAQGKQKMFKNHEFDSRIQFKENQNSKAESSYRPYQFSKFNVEDYQKIYNILKSIHQGLKVPVIESLTLLRDIKNYLQLVAMGGLDHIEGYDLPLHRLKIIKNALLYQRIAVVIVSFAFAVAKTKQSLKYLINMISYASNNTLLVLKILEDSQLTKQTAKNPIIAKSDRLILKRNFDSVRNSNDIILDAIFKIAKQEEAFFESFRDIVKSVGKNSLQQTFYNVLEYFAFFLCVSNLHGTIPFLAVAPNPYLRETADKRPTLVIDIVQVFCHGTRKSRSHIFRPHTEYFLSEMSQYYEIISFTCAYPNQIDKVIDILDHKKHIKHRLYRHHALSKHNVLFKDVQRIGRDLRRLILLDSETNGLHGEVGNTIMIPVWRGSKNDTILAELCPILASIAVKNMDCQQAIKKINQQHVKNQSAGIKYLNFGINLE